MAHPNETVIRNHLAALADGNVAAALADYAEEGVLHYPGRNALSGDHKGRTEVAAFLAKAMTLTGGSFRPDVHAILADDSHVVLLVSCSAERDGKRYDWLAADAYHVDDGKITEHWIMEGDQHAVDELFHA